MAELQELNAAAAPHQNSLAYQGVTAEHYVHTIVRKTIKQVHHPTVKQQLHPPQRSALQHSTARQTQRNTNRPEGPAARAQRSSHLTFSPRQSKARQPAAANMGIPYSKQINAAFDQG